MDAAKDAGKNLSNVICSTTGKVKGYRFQSIVSFLSPEKIVELIAG
jgi:hypothetical protein